MQQDPYIDRANAKGVNPLVYWLARAVLQPFFHIWFRVSRIGREHIPAEGGFIIAANHRSFLDPFVIGIMVRRPIYFIAKRELFTRRPVAWFLNNLGAFPINRGAADEDAMATARAILERGDGVLIFPEGTRIRPGSIGSPKRGVGRLALETGVPVVPLSIIGTEAVRRGWRIRPHKVRVRAGRPLTFPRVAAPSPQLAAAVTERIWPCVALQWEWLGGTPPVRRAVVVGGGAWGTTVAAGLARAGVEVQEGDDVAIADLVVLAVPGRRLPAAVAAHAAAIPARAGVLVLSRGLVPDGDAVALPSAYVAAHTRARAVASFAGPGPDDDHASLVVAGEDAGWVRQLADVLGAGGLDVQASSDVVGVELAAAATDAAVLAAGTAAIAGPGAAGAAAAKVFAEVGAYARSQGGRPETLTGLAGVGDLVAGVLAGAGRADPGRALPAAAQRDHDDGLTLLAAALAADGVAAPVTAGLAQVVAGDGSAHDWAHGVTAPARRIRRERLSA